MNAWVLNLLIWLPVIGGCFVLASGSAQRARILAMITALLSVALCIPLYIWFDKQSSGMQFIMDIPWIQAYNIRYAIGVDGISMPLILLTVFSTLIVIMAGWKMVQTKVAQYMAGFLILQGMMIGVFSSLDSILFYVFWEAMLIPMYLNIGIWGSENRTYASIKFFIYTFFGSALMLIALLYLSTQTNSFSIASFYPVKLAMSVQILLFIAFLLAFAIKVPMWPVHTWLPDAHTEAPAGGSIILAAIMLKMGGYGFLRFTLPIVPDASQALAWFMIALSLIAIVYIGFIAIVQADMKKLIAYSSVAHMGFVTLGCFMIYPIIAKSGHLKDAYMSIEGAMVQMISHGFTSGALFLGIGMLYERLHTRIIKEYGGVAHSMPVFSAFFMLFAMANVGLPGTSGFVGEFMVLLSAFKAQAWITIIAASTLILAAGYTLWMYKRVFFGEVVNAHVEQFKDINGLEKLTFGLLAFAVVALGVYPNPLLDVLHSSTGQLLELYTRSKL